MLGLRAVYASAPLSKMPSQRQRTIAERAAIGFSQTAVECQDGWFSICVLGTHGWELVFSAANLAKEPKMVANPHERTT